MANERPGNLATAEEGGCDRLPGKVAPIACRDGSGRRQQRRVRSPGSAPFQQRLEELARIALGALHNILRSARGHYQATTISPVGAEVDQPVGGLYHVEVVLDDYHSVALFDEPGEDTEQLADVLEVQARRGLVEYVQGPSRRPP